MSEVKYVIFDKVEYLVIGNHPLHPAVVLEHPDGTFITMSLGAYLKIVEKE